MLPMSNAWGLDTLEGWCVVHDSPWDVEADQCVWADSVDRLMASFECERDEE